MCARALGFGFYMSYEHGMATLTPTNIKKYPLPIAPPCSFTHAHTHTHARAHIHISKQYVTHPGDDHSHLIGGVHVADYDRPPARLEPSHGLPPGLRHTLSAWPRQPPPLPPLRRHHLLHTPQPARLESHPWPAPGLSRTEWAPGGVHLYAATTLSPQPYALCRAP